MISIHEKLVFSLLQEERIRREQDGKYGGQLGVP